MKCPKCGKELTYEDYETYYDKENEDENSDEGDDTAAIGANLLGTIIAHDSS